LKSSYGKSIDRTGRFLHIPPAVKISSRAETSMKTSKGCLYRQRLFSAFYIFIEFAAGTMVLDGITMNLYPIWYIHPGREMSRHLWFGRASLLLLAVCILTRISGQIYLS
jgi:hypothetical protein